MNQSVMEGEDVTLVCEAEGDLPLRLTWGSSPVMKLPPAQSRHTASGLISEIHIHSFSRIYSGAYYCNAQNDFGRDNLVIYLTVKGR